MENVHFYSSFLNRTSFQKFLNKSLSKVNSLQCRFIFILGILSLISVTDISAQITSVSCGTPLPGGCTNDTSSGTDPNTGLPNSACVDLGTLEQFVTIGQNALNNAIAGGNAGPVTLGLESCCVVDSNKDDDDCMVSYFTVPPEGGCYTIAEVNSLGAGTFALDCVYGTDYLGETIQLSAGVHEFLFCPPGGSGAKRVGITPVFDIKSVVTPPVCAGGCDGVIDVQACVWGGTDLVGTAMFSIGGIGGATATGSAGGSSAAGMDPCYTDDAVSAGDWTLYNAQFTGLCAGTYTVYAYDSGDPNCFTSTEITIPDGTGSLADGCPPSCADASTEPTLFCDYVINNPTSPMALADCDGGGVDNLTECQNGTDPADSSDDCDLILDGTVDVCALLMSDPTSPLASLDCDGDGLTNADECTGGTDPSDPCSNTFATAADLCAFILANPTSPLALADCDGSGVDNLTECQNGQDPTDSSDDCDLIMDGTVDVCALLMSDPTNPLATTDCDDDGISNGDECAAGTDPTDPCSNTYPTGADLCTYILANPTSPFATADCDGGGVDNLTECQNGLDPLMSGDDCMMVLDGSIDVCALLMTDPTNPLGSADCDGDGITNADECSAGTDPIDPCSNTYATGADLCAFILANPMSDLATADCDGGGIDNITECMNGGDPLDMTDDCTFVSGSVVDICSILMTDPTNPLATEDCDMDGISNADECAAGTDPTDPCSNTYATGADLCAFILANPTGPLAMADCDGGGVNNLTECQNGNDPTDPADDCDLVLDGTIDVCMLLMSDPMNPLATSDCDGDGISNGTECDMGTDPTDPCSNTYMMGSDVCTFVLANPTSPLALADCDGGGIDNLTECQNGEDPTDSSDDCDLVADGTVDVCALLMSDPTNPMATQDCDGDGIDNATECAAGTDPSDPCSNTYPTGADLCAYVLANPTSPIALADCDGGGIDNLTECQNGEDPTDPSDDCDLVQDGTVDVCALLIADPTNTMATADCDGDGIDNATECNAGTDPADPCSNTYATGADLCVYVLANPTSPLALADCDGGGVDNLAECQSGNDPLDDSDDCGPYIDGTIDLCMLLATDPTHPAANADCDGDGISNIDECNAGTDPIDPCSNTYPTGADLCAYVLANPTSMLAIADCDGGGIDNLTECQNGNDPTDPSDDCDLVADGTVDVCALLMADPTNPMATMDCDEDGISNADECAAGTDPTDPCDNTYATGADACVFILANPTSAFATADCDGGGIDNLTECQNGNDPTDSGDDCDLVLDGTVDVCALLLADPTNSMATMDCDEDGISNADECAAGTDPTDPCNNTYATGADACVFILANPTSAFATADCDGGGINNLTECQNGNDPTDPGDDCDLVQDVTVDVCALLVSDPTNPMATMDCDDDGIDNATECAAGTDPTDPCSNTYPTGADLCTYILANPTSAIATADCDGGGIDNLTECQNGNDPMVPGDDCSLVQDGTVDVCALLLSDPTKPLATSDCDEDGIDNATECAAGTDPTDPCSNTYTSGADVCAFVLANPMSALAEADCDGGGINNLIECTSGGDPLMPGDDCSFVSGMVVDICDLLESDPTNPLATADCDGDGISNADECAAGTDPIDPCSNTYPTGADACIFILANPTSAFALADCDGGGIDNLTECQNGNDPTAPGDDCDLVQDGTVDVCALLVSDPTNPMATQDCDGDGIDNATECAAGTDPTDPCSSTYSVGADMCAYVLANPTSAIALADCDGGGIDNLTECQNGGDPLLTSDDCDLIQNGTIDVCALLMADPTNPMATMDCDGDGISNADECAAGTDPTDPCDNTYATGADACVFILANPTSAFATADCDGGGIDNLTECQNGNDPTDPGDDCDLVLDGTVDVCALLMADPTNPMATMDCDEDGISNADECAAGTDPTDPCDNTYATGADACVFILANPTSAFATADCDGGGIDNLTECQNGNDPTDPGDDCDLVLDGTVDVCALLMADPTNPMATMDCDEDGISNADECAAGTDPTDPCDNTYATGADACVFILANPTSAFATADCDGGGIDNLTECQNGNDPTDPGDDCDLVQDATVDVCALLMADPTNPMATMDCDEDGISNADECAAGTDPTDPCDNTYATGADACVFILANPTSAFATADCDGGGIDNLTECQNGNDPTDPGDDCDLVLDATVDVCALLMSDPTNPMATMDCDEDGISNADECAAGTDPTDPCDNTYATGADACVFILANPTSAFATADCDGGGVDNLTECQNGNDPFVPGDDCMLVVDGTVDVCVLLISDPTNSLATADCDMDGETNAEECAAGTDPTDPCSNSYASGADLCTYILTNPTSMLATADCDGGGIDNLTECMNGGDPLDNSDDCGFVSGSIVDICALLATDPTNPLATEDCDMDGESNAEECAAGTDPTDPCSNSYASGADLCIYILANPTSMLAMADCDGGGVDNLTECQNGNDPTDPGDDCDLVQDGTVDVCALLLANPMNPLATMDCDEDGIDNSTECAMGTDPTDPCDNTYATGADACVFILANPTSAFATADCDGGGIDNLTECQNGNDPTDPGDDCDLVQDATVDVCALLMTDPTNPMATMDCDEDGISNADECAAGTDPTDPCDNTYATGADACVFILANPTSAFATADCDGGGIDNLTECQNGNDPTDPGDDCDLVLDATVDVCALLMSDPTNPMATMDCDEDGISNADECAAGTDPTDPCDNTYATGADACVFILANPTSAFATADCDGGGVDNLTECQNGNDPFVPGDDCMLVVDGTVDVCVLLISDPTNSLATADCDMDGETNAEECAAGTDPTDPCSNSYASGADLCTYILANPTSMLATADCDGGGIDNLTECMNGGDPLDNSDDCGFVSGSIVDICALLATDPTNPLATEDCDMDGESNAEECAAGTDPIVPCSNSYASGADLCIYILANPTSMLAMADCDGGGVDNLTECQNGNDPSDPGDDCDLVQDGTVDVCALLLANPMNPLATMDCDEDGIDNSTECAMGTDPTDPCDNIYATGADACVFILANPTSAFATADCDGGGIDNLTECQNGNDPTDPSDDCDLVQDATVDVCALLMADPSNPMATMDCDEDGISNADECAAGTDPTDPCDNTYATGADACVFILANPTSAFAAADCDGGGIDNLTECQNGNDPTDPGDDCDLVQDATVDVCALLMADPTNPMATMDCDEDGISNADECAAGTDPTDPCDNTYATGADACVFIIANPTSAFATADCDGGGIDNLTECQNGNDPTDPGDDCDLVLDGTIDVCALLMSDPTNPMATMDCDEDGISNADECAAGTDPTDPCDNTYATGADACVFILANPTSAFATADCDGGGIDNLTECQNGNDPTDPGDDCDLVQDATVDVCALLMSDPTNPMATMDCDEDGISNADECAVGTDPTDPCDNTYATGADACVFILANPTSAFATADCDGGGIDNLTECQNGNDPTDPGDDCDLVQDGIVDVCALLMADPTNPMATMDCDEDGISNADECAAGTDPTNPCDNTYATGADACVFILANPTSAFATADCDGGGIDNLTECQNGNDPTDPGDDCDLVQDATVDVCALLMADPTNPMATMDCDEDGISNADECAAGTDPTDPCDNTYSTGADACVFILSNPTSAFATADCDGGGIDNLTECQNGNDPTDPGDDCDLVQDATVDVCALLMADPTNPMATMDCDEDGISNADECAAGTDPTDPCDNTYATGADACVFIIANPTSAFATADCDGGGIDNLTECQNGNDPTDPGDDCDLVLDGTIDVCALLVSDPTNPMATMDCDEDGISNADECAAGTDPADPCSHTYTSGAALCAFVIANPTSMLAQSDCDKGGIDNLMECQNGKDPLAIGDDCDLILDGTLDVCTLIAANPGNPMATMDCDDDGIDNAQECADGTDPTDPCSVGYSSMTEICFFINSNPNSAFAQADCDGGGVINLIECQIFASLPVVPGAPVQSIFDSGDDCVIPCDMTCISQLNLSLREEDCSAEINPSMLIPGLGIQCDFPAARAAAGIVIEIFDENGNRLEDEFGEPTNLVTLDYLGQNITYQITNNGKDPVTGEVCGNSCWGNLLVEYKHLPQIACPVDMTLSCGALDVLPLPDVSGGGACNAEAFEIYLANEVREKIECGELGAEDYTHVVTRTYVATDALGNTASCSHTIMLERIDLGGLEFPPNASVNCSELSYFILADSGVPLPWLTGGLTGSGTAGVPVICHPDLVTTTGLVCPSTGSGTGIPLIPQLGATILTPDGPELIAGDVVGNCSAAITYTDVMVPQIGCTKKVIRTWEIREWYCGEELPIGPHNQLIEIKDDMAPVIECPAAFIVTTNDNCAGDIALPAAITSDGCDNGTNVTIEHPWGIVDGNGGTATLEVGTHIVTYKVSDNCYNSSSCTTTVTIRDNTEPVAICEQYTVVSISQDGNTFVSSDVFDDGSWDECGDVKTCAMKMEDVLRYRALSVDTVYQGVNYVERSRMEDGCIQDYVAGVTLDGVAYLTEDDLCIPYVRFCCSDVGTDQMVIFRASDHGGNYSDCMVTVEVQDKSIPTLECPSDVTIDCRVPYALDNLSLQFGGPIVVDNCSDLQPLSETTDADVNQCGIGTIVRLFEVKDGFGTVVRSCKQHIEINNQTPFGGDIEWPLDFESTCGTASQLVPEVLTGLYAYPTFPSGDDQCSLLGFDYEDQFFAGDPTTGECGVIRRSWTVIDWCSTVNGEFVTYPLTGPYIQTIKIENDVAPVIDAQADVVFTSASVDCVSTDIQVWREATDDCTPEGSIDWSYSISDADGNLVTTDVNGVALSGADRDIKGTFGSGSYSILWTACDGCGNCSTSTQSLEVVNTKTPIPVCMNGLSITLDDNGNAELWASDVDAGSYHPCGNDFTLGFNALTDEQVLYFNCTHLGEQFVDMYVRDTRSGVSDYCTARIVLTDPLTACVPGNFLVAGEVYTEELHYVEDVKVELGANMPFEMTDEVGEYAFGGMPMGGDYMVAPEKDVEYLNGVSTLDLILIQRHILGIETLSSPYKLIAADINSSSDINGLDLVELRKLILGIYTELPANDSWRFVDAGHEFVNELNPWEETIPEDYEIVDLATDMTIDFIGVKIGDVNGTAITSSADIEIEDRRNRWPLVLEVEEQSVKQGEVFTMKVYGRNYERISGWQTTLNFDKQSIEILEVNGKSASIEGGNHNITRQEEGWMTMSYHSLETESKSADEVLFELVIRAKQNINTAELLELSSAVTAREAYRGYNEIVDIRLDVRKDEQTKIVSVNPNPWITSTEIAFHMPQAGEGKWVFFDVNGRVLYSKTEIYEQGQQLMRLNRSDIDGTGIIYMKLTTDNGVAEHKMIVVK